MNKKLYLIDSLTFLFGLALLLAAKGFGNLSIESGYHHLKWAFLAIMVLFTVFSNWFYYRNTGDAEIHIGNAILPLASALLFTIVFFNPLVEFCNFPNAPITANIIILSGIFCILGAHFFYCFGIYLCKVGLIKTGGDPRATNGVKAFGTILRRISPFFLVIGELITILLPFCL